MKILFVVHGYKPAYRIGGPILSVSALAEKLVEKGHEVTVFTTNSNQSEDLDIATDCAHIINGVEVWYFKRKQIGGKAFSFITYFAKSIGYLYVPELKKNLKRLLPDIDVVHTHLPFIYPTFIAGKLSKLYSKPLFYHQRGVLDPERLNFRAFKKKWYIKLVERPIINNATTLIALSKYEVESFRAICSEQKVIHTIPNGINIGDYRIISTEREILGISSQAPVILFLGRIHPIKGADVLIEAFFLVNKVIPEAVLVMAGPDEFNLESRFKSIVRERGLTQKILFPGMVTGEFKKNLLARANIFALPSAGEGFSMAILEALASENAVIISPGCHFPEIEENNAGLVVSIDPSEWAKALIKLISNPETMNTMGRNGRILVAKEYTWDKITDEMIKTYMEGILRNKELVKNLNGDYVKL
jgi:glycosyltransferase involved in cell wall biosynthesis